MLKKNQLALILLTLVLMLSIYYIKSPFTTNEEEPDNQPGDAVTSGRLEQLADLRAELTSKRDAEILELDAIISSDEATVEDKKVAYERKDFLNVLTETELLLENQLISSGYRDVFVEASSRFIEITLITSELTDLERGIITTESLNTFAEKGVYNQVIIDYRSVDEVMGTASAN